jgi:hypothetical protein
MEYMKSTYMYITIKNYYEAENIHQNIEFVEAYKNIRAVYIVFFSIKLC